LQCRAAGAYQMAVEGVRLGVREDEMRVHQAGCWLARISSVTPASGVAKQVKQT